jgi:hypothetical protein
VHIFTLRTAFFFKVLLYIQASHLMGSTQSGIVDTEQLGTIMILVRDIVVERRPQKVAST